MPINSYLYDAKGRDQQVDLSADTLKQIGKQRLLWIDVDTRDPAELKRNFQLAGALGATGTPLFIVGDRVMNSAVGYAVLKKAIADARAKRG